MIYQMHQKEKKEKQRSFGILPQIPSVVISTSSIELQHALAGQYLGELSDILLEARLIPRPITYIVRKGKEHFLCRHRLISFIKAMDHIKDEEQYTILEELYRNPERIDLDRIQNISEKTINRINIPAFCGSGCKYNKKCFYMEYIEKVGTKQFDIQICNHNYYLASEAVKKKTGKGLLQPYRFLIVDEAHKLEEAAMQINSIRLHSRLLLEFSSLCRQALYGRERKEVRLVSVIQKMEADNRSLFWVLQRKVLEDTMFELPYLAKGYVTALKRGMDEFEILGKELQQKNIAIRRYVIRIRQILDVLTAPNACLYEYQRENFGANLTAYPRDTAPYLSHLWKEYEPRLLISGTLAVEGDFSYFKRRIGMEAILPVRITDEVFRSSFSYQEHARLYISEKVPSKNIRSEVYLKQLTEEIGELINASKGRAVILFTSYRLLAETAKRLKGKISYPLFQTSREDKTVIERFRSSKNGVLLATGAIWEGIDFSGEILSLLIIPVLPFPVPDTVSDNKKKGYDTLQEFISKEVTPAMVMKLKQGTGRLIRTETDRGVVAILDRRAALKGRYRGVVLDVLKEYPICRNISEVREFLSKMKDRDPFDEK